MSPWLFLGWVVAVAAALIVAVFAIAVVIALVRNAVGKPIENRKLRKTVNAN